MDRDSELKAFIMKAATIHELTFAEDDIVPIEFCAMINMATGEYYDIQYVIFERPSKRSIWKCSSLGNDEYYFYVLSIDGDEMIIRHVDDQQ